MAHLSVQPPMPVRVDLVATVRETDRPRHDFPVARVDFVDVIGESRTLDFTPELAIDLLRQLAAFVTQVGCQGRS